MDVRQPENLRDKPPACALPTTEEVASSCAIRDLVTAPGYQSPAYDEEGVAISAQAIPEYGVRELRCRFTSRHRNRAVCRFNLTLPQGAKANAAVTFEHLFWADHGPAHHFYGTRWSPTDRCTPAATVSTGGK